LAAFTGLSTATDGREERAAAGARDASAGFFFSDDALGTMK
jgi:hypothetical protein